MKWIFMMIVSVLVFDAFVAKYFFNLSWALPGASLLLFIFSYVLFHPRIKKASPAQGWVLGEAQELSDPNNPVSVKNALISKKALNLGLIALGGLGAGKTESVIMGQLKAVKGYSPNSGFALFDGKGDIDTYKKFVAMGEKPDFMFSSELPGSDSINLLSGEPSDVLDRLTHLLIGTTASTDFYLNDQRAVLSRIIPLLLKLNLPVNLRDLYVVLAVPKAGYELIKTAKALDLDPAEISLAESWLDTPAKERLKNIAGMLSRLMIFVTGPHADRLNCYQPDINVQTMVEQGQTLYAHLPFTEFSKDVAVALIDMLEVAARKRQLGGVKNLSVYPMFFDDWSGFFHSGFSTFAARCRSAEMPLSFGFQSIAHLDAVSPTFLTAIDDTIVTKIIMRVHGNATSEFVQKLLCDFEIAEITQSDSTVKGETMMMRKEARIDRRALRELSPGQAYVSTTMEDGKNTINPIWKVQLQRPDFSGWQDVALPEAKAHEEGEGLGFWKKYMAGEDMKVLNARIKKVLEEETALKRTGSNAGEGD